MNACPTTASDFWSMFDDVLASVVAPPDDASASDEAPAES